MRLTLINLFYLPDISPTAHLAASLAEHRAACGDRVTVLTSRAGYLGQAGPAVTSSSVRVRRLWSTRLGSRSNLRRLLDWATFFVMALYEASQMPRQDVVIAMTTPPFVALAGWLHKLRNPSCRLILWSMDVYPEALERTNLIGRQSFVAVAMRAAHRAIFRRLDHLICLDQAMADLLLSQYLAPHSPLKTSIIPNWERADAFPLDQAVPPWSDPLAAQLHGKFVVIYLGNAGYGHEFQTMLNAAADLGGSNVIFLFVGGGALRPWIEKQCRARRITNVIFHDYVPKERTPAVMALAHCALITLENAMSGVMSPSKLHSNLAMSLPVIYVGPAGVNVDQAITRFGCGISLRPGEWSAMATFIRNLVAEPDRAADLRRRARKAFDEAYCDRQTLPMLDAVIDQAETPTSGL